MILILLFFNFSKFEFLCREMYEKKIKIMIKIKIKIYQNLAVCIKWVNNINAEVQRQGEGEYLSWWHSGKGKGRGKGRGKKK